MNRASRFLASALLLVSVGCGGAGASGTDAGGANDANTVGSVTYYGDVRPILAEHCVRCHHDGSIAPFVLDTYEAARSVAPLITTATQSRIMPPYLVNDTGSCNHYPDSPWLTDRELAVLAAWDAQGTPMGDPATPPPVVDPGPMLTGPLTTVSTGVDYLPVATGHDDYRCFVIESPSATDFFVTGYDFHPGTPSIVHHAALFVPTDDASNAMLPSIDDAAVGAGYPCFGGPNVNALFVVGWGPGMGAVDLPAHTGIQVAGGYRMILQIHYNTTAPGTAGLTDLSTMDLETTTSGVIQAVMLPVGGTDLSLPPHMASVDATSMYSLQADYGFPSVGVHAYGIFPHMHTLGQALSMEVVHADGSTTCLGDVEHWNFNWQRAYFYETPLAIQPTDRLHLTCTFDTRSRTDTTVFGENTDNEMCFGVLYISI